MLCLAAIGGLMHFRRPEVTIEGSDVTVHSPEEKAPIKLTLHHKPFTITLGYIDGKEESKDEKIIILDPNRHEQNILGGSISIAVNKHREVPIKKNPWKQNLKCGTITQMWFFLCVTLDLLLGLWTD